MVLDMVGVSDELVGYALEYRRCAPCQAVRVVQVMSPDVDSRRDVLDARPLGTFLSDRWGIYRMASNQVGLLAMGALTL